MKAAPRMMPSGVISSVSPATDSPAWHNMIYQSAVPSQPDQVSHHQLDPLRSKAGTSGTQS
ncbi:hypothetical protein BJX99DRAFT_220807 [Aspergillus californicus]